MYLVSVPIRGLFNLTGSQRTSRCNRNNQQVSVPIRGLFNLTYVWTADWIAEVVPDRFRPHQGII